MTPEELNSLIVRAREAGVLHGFFGYDLGTLAALLDFYGDERAAQERERCAKVVDEQSRYWAIHTTREQNADYDPAMRERNIARARHWHMMCFRLASAIRALP